MLVDCSGHSLCSCRQFGQRAIIRRTSSLLPPSVRWWRRLQHGSTWSGGTTDPGRRSRCHSTDHCRLPWLGGVSLSLGRRAGASTLTATYHRQLNDCNVGRQTRGSIIQFSLSRGWGASIFTLTLALILGLSNPCIIDTLPTEGPCRPRAVETSGPIYKI